MAKKIQSHPGKDSQLWWMHHQLTSRARWRNLMTWPRKRTMT